MSAIADFRLIETSKLSDLKAHAEVQIKKTLFSKKTVDSYWTYLDANSLKLKDFPWSGHIFSSLLIFLEEKKGIGLLRSSHDDIADNISELRQSGAFILTFDHKQKHLKDLSPDKFSLEELIEFNVEFSEENDPELAQACIAGIKALRDSLELLTDDKSVVLLSIG